MPLYQQVSGGACSLTMYPETSPGVVAPGTTGTNIALYSENFALGNSKKPRTVISGKRGPGKPYEGLPQITGTLESASYAPQLGVLLRALCGAASTVQDTERTFDAGAAVELNIGFVGLPCAGHGFVQDDVITISGTENYNGVYRVESGTTADMLVIAAPYLAEALTTDAKACRGRAAFLAGAARDLGGGKVGLPVSGGVHALNPGENITIAGTTDYDGAYTLLAETGDDFLAISATYEAESFDGAPLAAPVFYRHSFALPKRQPTICMEKYLDFEPGAVVNPYRRYNFCKVNGLSFNFGGDDELKFSFDFAVGKETPAPAPLSANPVRLPGVVMDNIETSLFIAGVRRGDVASGAFTNTFGIEPKAAVGDLGQYSRMPEGDPDCKATLSVFLETEDLQGLADDCSTVPFDLVICAATGEKLTFSYPEAEIDAAGPAITGKEGLMQDYTVMAFVDAGQTVLTAELINRVQAYA
jgi:hypothetical protein